MYQKQWTIALSTTEPIHKKNTLRNYQYILSKFLSYFPDRDLESVSSDEILYFLTQLTEGTKQATKRRNYALLAAFFTLIKNTLNSTLGNPCDTVMLRTLFRPAKAPQWTILDKRVMDETIFRTIKNRRIKIGVTSSSSIFRVRFLSGR